MATAMETTEPARADERAQPALGDGRKTIVIVGNGMVGHRLCERLTRADAPVRFRVVVFGEETRPAYDRIHLTDMLGGRTAQSLELDGFTWYERRGIELVLDDPVVSVDRAGRRVRARSGREESFDHLVFATGAVPLVPDIEGKDLAGVFVYRTVADLERIAAFRAGVTRAAVVGGGLLGLEAARALLALGLEVTVLEAAPHVLPNQLDPAGALRLEAAIQDLGLRVRCGVRITRIAREESGLRLELADGDPDRADLVVLSIGVRPQDKLAAYAGLGCGPRGGIVVDDGLRTSDPDIFAVGDCAVHDDLAYGLVAPGYRMADALAQSLLGNPVRFSGGDRSARLKLLGVDVVSLGAYQAQGKAVTFQTGKVYRKLVVQEGRVVGAIGVGPWPEIGEMEQAISARARVWPWQSRRFSRSGRLYAGSNDRPVAEWPAAAIVCHCIGVSRGTLSAVVDRGRCTVEALVEGTGASTACGSCRPRLCELLGEKVTPSRPAGRRVLAGAALGAAGLSAGWLLAGPIPFATSVQLGTGLDELWRSGLARQVTGFGLLAVCLAELLLSVRKRWRRFSFGAFPWWRAVHGVLGALSLLMLVLHTGLRAGENFNRILFLDFLAVNALGAIAGAFFASDLSTRPRAAQSQRLSRLCHAALVWPLPTLVAFHVLAAYWF